MTQRAKLLLLFSAAVALGFFAVITGASTGSRVAAVFVIASGLFGLAALTYETRRRRRNQWAGDVDDSKWKRIR